MSNCINIPLSFKQKNTHIEHQNQRFGHQNQWFFLLNANFSDSDNDMPPNDAPPDWQLVPP